VLRRRQGIARPAASPIFAIPDQRCTASRGRTLALIRDDRKLIIMPLPASVILIAFAVVALVAWFFLIP